MKKKAFTLVEIMFVTAIIGLLAALGLPAILNAMNTSTQRLVKANLGVVERAKGMLQLPPLIHACGLGLTNGTPYGAGNYTEKNLMLCVQNKQRLLEFHFKNAKLVPGTIGKKASYNYDL